MGARKSGYYISSSSLADLGLSSPAVACDDGTKRGLGNLRQLKSRSSSSSSALVPVVVAFSEDRGYQLCNAGYLPHTIAQQTVIIYLSPQTTTEAFVGETQRRLTARHLAVFPQSITYIGPNSVEDKFFLRRHGGHNSTSKTVGSVEHRNTTMSKGSLRTCVL